MGVRFHKHLGVYITCTLNWSKQFEEVQKKANRVLAVLQHNIHSAPPKVKERAYQTLVRPITEYACAVWSPYTAKELQLLSRFKGVRPDLCLMTIRDLQVCLP